MAATTQGPSLVVGADYDRAITALESDRRARAAFQQLVARIVAPDAALYDFGAGTGIDARVYADRGHTVGAYDVDPGMRQQFALRCRDLIDAGRVTLDTGSYSQFLAGTVNAGRRVDLVTSNFAPLNLIAQLPPLFEKFHALTVSGGKLLVSVLNPYFIGDLKYGWWWRNGMRLWRAGHYSVAGTQAAITRRRLADFARQAAPYFALTHVFRGSTPHRGQGPGGIDMTRGGRSAWLRVASCRFMFLLFERRDNDGRSDRDHSAAGPSNISSTNVARSRE